MGIGRSELLECKYKNARWRLHSLELSEGISSLEIAIRG